jgi:uridine phosphorylase
MIKAGWRRSIVAGILGKGKQFHLHTDKDSIGGYVLLCGDPGRVRKIAMHLENAKPVAENREFITFTGMLRGQRVSVSSTGIGGPSAAICVEELIKCGAHTFIRVGTSGGIKKDVAAGDLIIAAAAVRDEGTSREYMPVSYPAAADFSVCKALYEEAETLCDSALGNAYHIGVVQSKDSFYGETNPETMPVDDFLQKRWNAYIKLGCLASEMECAAIFSVAQTRGVRAGAVLLAIWNAQLSLEGAENKVVMDTGKAIACAVGAIKRLIESDKEKK